MLMAGVLIQHALYAQNESPLGRYCLDYTVGCAPLTVNVTSKDSFGMIVRQYLYEPDLPLTSDTTYTYTQPGTYRLVQFVQSQTPRTDTITVVVTEPEVPQYEIYSCPQNSARVEVENGVYDFYRVYFDNNIGLPDSLDVAPGAISDAIRFQGSDLQDLRIQGFINGGPPNCGSVSFSFAPINDFQAPVISNLTVNQHCVDLLEADLEVSMTERVRHEVQYSLNGNDYITLDTIIDITTFNATDIPGGSREVCFRLATLDECGNTKIFSDVRCESGLLLSMRAISEAEASFTGGRVVIDWPEQEITPTVFTINRAEGEGSFNEIGTSMISAYTDTDARNASRLYSYRIFASDTCGNNSEPSILIRPVFLQALEESTNTYQFAWTDYLGWTSDQINYFLEVLNDQGTVLASFPVSFNTSVRNIGQDADRNFRIKAVNARNGKTVNSNTVTLERTAEVIIPTAFTPNGDGLNDVFLPVINDVERFEMKIFNRWGELLFISNSIFEGWDGGYKRGVVTGGTYIYQISLRRGNGIVINQSGTFLLMK